MDEILKYVVVVLEKPETREQAISVAQAAFDKYMEPIDLPGPDAAIDPLLRAAIAPVVGAIFDSLLKELKEKIDA